MNPKAKLKQVVSLLVSLLVNYTENCKMIIENEEIKQIKNLGFNCIDSFAEAMEKDNSLYLKGFSPDFTTVRNEVKEKIRLYLCTLYKADLIPLSWARFNKCDTWLELVERYMTREQLDNLNLFVYNYIFVDIPCDY